MSTAAPETLVVECCRDLIRAPSPSGREGDAARVAEAWMVRLGFDSVRVDLYGSVVGVKHGRAGRGPHLLLDGHLDTVPVASPELWSHLPFAGEVADGLLFGRGAADMKGPLAAMLCAVGSVPAASLRGTVTVSASVAEEVLEGAALAAIVDEVAPDMVVIGEGTGLRVGVAQKGRAGIRITTSGRAAHSSTPELGINAVYAMLDVVARVRAAALPVDPLLGPALMELTEITSEPTPGDGMVPSGCTTRWDRRVVRGETAAGILDELRRALAGVGEVEVAYERPSVDCYTGSVLRLAESFFGAWAIDEDDMLVHAALDAVRQVGVAAPETAALPYCTNGSACAADRGLPTIILGPGEPSGFHVVDEHIAVEDLARGMNTYAGLVTALLGDRGGRASVAPPRTAG